MNRLPSGPSFAVLCGVSVLLWFRPLLNTFALASGSDRYTHIFLIIPVTAALIIEMIALVLWWIGSFALCYGPHTLRAFRFPLLFLLWMVPIPARAVDWIV